MSRHLQLWLRSGAVFCLAAGLSGCGDNAVTRFVGTVGACLGGDAHRFSLYGSPTINVLRVDNQLPQVTARIPMEVGRPCEALQGGSSTVQGIRVLREGTPVQIDGNFSAGIYTLRFAELVQPRRHRYEIQATSGTTAAASPLNRISLDIDAASPIQGFPRLSVNTPNLPQATLRWTPTTGHGGYRLQFTYDDPANEGSRQTVLMHLAPELTSYQFGMPVQGDPVIEQGRQLALPAAIADARGHGLKPGLRLSVTIGAFRFIPGTTGDRLASGTDWEHRSLPITLNP